MTSIDRAAASLRRGSRAFTRRNLFYAAARLGGTRDLDAFDDALAARLRRGPIEGLLPPKKARARRLSEEWEAYFPAAILLVDRPQIVDLFAASGAIVLARLAVVCVDGSPETVVEWLRRGARRGFGAPVGWLHDAATVRYPFHCEPLASLVDALPARTPLPYRDLGLPPRGLAPSLLPFAGELDRPVLDLEEPPPAALVGYATRTLMSMMPRDPWLVPLSRRGGRHDRRP